MQLALLTSDQDVPHLCPIRDGKIFIWIIFLSGGMVPVLKVFTVRPVLEASCINHLYLKASFSITSNENVNLLVLSMHLS